MKCNVGKSDRIFRMIAGLVIIFLGIFFKSWWGALGIIPVITSATGFCGLYVPFKINTNKTKAVEK